MGSKQLAVIYDRTGMARANQDTQLMKFSINFAQMLQDFYAERLSMFYVLGANWLYKLAYAVIKPFLAKKTKDKVTLITLKLMQIKILDTVVELREYFNEDQLLPEHGGTS